MSKRQRKQQKKNNNIVVKPVKIDVNQFSEDLKKQEELNKKNKEIAEKMREFVRKEKSKETSKKETTKEVKKEETTKETKNIKNKESEEKETMKETKETNKETKKPTLTERVLKLESFMEKQLEFDNSIVDKLKISFEKINNKLDSLSAPTVATKEQKETKKEVKKETKVEKKQSKEEKKETKKKEVTTKATQQVLNLQFDVSKDTIKKSFNEDMRDLYLLKQKASHDIKNIDYSTVSKIFAYCFYTLKDNEEKINGYIDYWTKESQKTKNKNNKKLTAEEIQERFARVLTAKFYLKNKVGQVMKMYA